jgi:hypothetical protein
VIVEPPLPVVYDAPDLELDIAEAAAPQGPPLAAARLQPPALPSRAAWLGLIPIALLVACAGLLLILRFRARNAQ